MSRQSVQTVFRTLCTHARALGLFRGSARLAWGRAQEFPADRDHGMTDGKTVWVAPRMAQAPFRRVAGVLSHELGHVALLRAGQKDHRETEADAIGERILGITIGYSRPLDVQEAGLRRKRPSYLPNPRR